MKETKFISGIDIGDSKGDYSSFVVMKVCGENITIVESVTEPDFSIFKTKAKRLSERYGVDLDINL